MTSVVDDILGPMGAIARRMGERYEHRPQQLELAGEVARAMEAGEHLLAEAGTGVGKSFAYLVPAIEYAVRNKKRVVISTHTISLQEQLIEKDIPLIQAVYPDEFTAVLVKGRSNYICRRRMEQARGRQGMLFENNEELSSLWAIEQWVAESDMAGGTGEGSLSDLRTVPLPQVWDKVAAEAGNCMGKKCPHYQPCYWQAAKRRMGSGNVLVVNHALFFSDLALRMAGVNYLPKYDVVVLDEAHTVEEVAGQHFGIKVSESSIKYNLRNLYDLRRGKGLLTALGAVANDAITSVIDLHEMTQEFFDRAIGWHDEFGRSNGRIREPNVVENTLSPKLRELSTKLRGLTAHTESDEEITELTALSNKVNAMAVSLEAVVTQSITDGVYWMEVGGKTPRRLTWHAAPVDVAEGLRRHLFEKMHSVVMTSATLGTGGSTSVRRGPRRDVSLRDLHGRDARDTTAGSVWEDSQVLDEYRGGGDAHRLRGVVGGQEGDRVTGVSPVGNRGAKKLGEGLRERGYLPHVAKVEGVYAINFRLADSVSVEVRSQWTKERDAIYARAEEQQRDLTAHEEELLTFYEGQRVDEWLDKAEGECLFRDERAAEIVQESLKRFDGDRYQLLAWCVMPNHVHAVVRPLEGHPLEAILHSWKSFTAHEVNKLLGRSGALWMEESYDRVIRSGEELDSQVEYAAQNAERAGMKDWVWCGRNVEAVAEAREFCQQVEVSLRDLHGRDARDTTPSVCVPAAFAYISRRLGVRERVRVFEASSPFEYGEQAVLYIEKGLPDPSDRMFGAAAREKVVEYLRKTNGGAFVLFTAYKPMIEMANSVAAELSEMGLNLLVQGQGAPRKVLLERFRSTPNSVLFGTSSFWQGVDVQGDALRNVIIVKLPFAVPDEPLTEAKLEAITKEGGNAFMEYSVPEAIIKLKQGFGRLIRSRRDKGIVVILDSRVCTKRYGKLFLEALPKAKIVEVGR